MEITVDALETRKNNILADIDMLKANLAACEGALQDCDFWLSQLENEGEASASPELSLVQDDKETDN